VEGKALVMILMRVGLALAAALLSIGLLAGGCTVVVGGKALPAPSLTPRSLTGQTVKRVLLDDSSLSRILDQPFKIDRRLPARFGGPEVLQDFGSASPVDCLGVAVMLQQNVYQSTNVQQVAVQAWRHAARPAAVTGVKEGVVSLPTAADANALFAKFSEQWQKCEGTTLPLSGNVFRLKAKTTNVEVGSSVDAATVSMAFALSSSDSASIQEARAIGVRGNCLVEVEVDFFDAANPPHQESGNINTSAVDVANAMMDKVTALI
jgi:PknH-like extracellular domain